MKPLRDAPILKDSQAAIEIVEEASQELTGIVKAMSQLLGSKADKKAVADLKAMAEKLSTALQGVLSQIKSLDQALKDDKTAGEVASVKAQVAELAGQLQVIDGLTVSIEALKQRTPASVKDDSELEARFLAVSDEAKQIQEAIKQIQEAVKSLNERPIFSVGGGGGISASGTPAENEYARFTKHRNLEGRTAAEARSDLDLEAGTDFPSLTTFNDHSARHEDGGDDELSLAGLSGTPAALTTHEGAADPHTTYVKHSLATAVSDFLVASGVGVFVKKTLAEVKTLLDWAADIATHAGLTTGVHGVGLGTVAKVGDIATDANLSAAAQAAITASHSVNDVGTHGTATTGVHGVGAGTVAKTADIAATKIDDLTAGDDNTDLDSNTTRHGLLVKGVAPAANLMNVPGIVNGETVFTNKPVFDATNPEALGTAAPGTAVIAAHRDHVHLDPVVAHAAASDPHTGYQKESEREAASGYAGLDGSSKVIKDPANATATPTASKIPIADGSAKLDGWVSAASLTVPGKVELATTAEIDAGTDSTRAMPVDQFVASERNVRPIMIRLVEKGTDVAVGTAIGGDFECPYTGTIVRVGASVDTAGTTNSSVIDINLAGATIMTTNKISIETTEKSSRDATQQPVLTTTAITAGQILTFDVDSLSTTVPKGLTVRVELRVA